MSIRKSFPNRIEARQKAALGRRLADIDKYNKLANTDESVKLKLDRAKSDVSALKTKLGLN